MTSTAILLLIALVTLSATADESPVLGVMHLPDHIQERISEHEKNFRAKLAEVEQEPGELLRRVDRDRGLSRDYVPEDLVFIRDTDDRVNVRLPELQVTKRTARALSQMTAAALDDGVELVVSSAYRSHAQQESLHEHWTETLGEELARALSAPAGHSQHQLGTTVDFAPVGRAFENTPQDEWLQANAWRHGFSLSYPAGYEELTGYNYESWHYRYIGRAASRLEKRFFDGIQHYLIEFLDRRTKHRSGR